MKELAGREGFEIVQGEESEKKVIGLIMCDENRENNLKITSATRFT
jgi:hypothetical protein